MPKSTDKRENWSERIVARGFRELAKEFHPDAGGTDEEFDRLHKAYTELREFAKDSGVSDQRAATGKAAEVKGVQLFLDIGHISTLLAGQPVIWTGPDGYQVHIRLAGGPGQLVADVIKNLLERKRKR